MIRGRWAPSPTGLLHLGSARTALVAWLSVRSQAGTFIWRTEDLDGPRIVAGMEEAGMEDLRWLGLDWNEGPDCGGPHVPYRQSARQASYHRALVTLKSKELLFPCKLSRADLRQVAAESTTKVPPYPRFLRPDKVANDWFENPDPDTSIRFKVHDRAIRFNDLVSGPVEEVVSASTGDFVVKRKDGLMAYQLAVVVDDIEMEVTEVVRGADLLDSTARQIQLYQALGARPPAFAHVPMVVEDDGRKLSKRFQSTSIASLREMGIHPTVLCGCLAHSLGLKPNADPVWPEELTDSFSWNKIKREPWIVPANLPQTLVARSA
ncbi:MAG: tRNA glutamyl-Q(34) synthetase GluQRS [Rhodothermales bacterium]|nr:tRNA glutamyl-Q(34) synthetase GluQRS [Rhodothermales bacterium]